QPQSSSSDNESAPTSNTEVAGPAPPAPQTPVVPPRPIGARPSFDCTNARTRGELAVCNDAGLATLDRQMAAEYGRAVAVASPNERELLRDTARRFYAYRDRCPDNRCIADAYVGRVKEIRDIMEGRWRPPQ